MAKSRKSVVPSRDVQLRRNAEVLRQQVERDNIFIDVLRRAYRLPPYHLRLAWVNPHPPRPSGGPRIGYGPGAA